MKFATALTIVLSIGSCSVSAFVPITSHQSSPSQKSAACRSTSSSTTLPPPRSPTSLLYTAGVSPETRQFTQHLKQILTNKRRQRTSAQEAEKLLLDTFASDSKAHPDVVSFTKVVSAWARSRRPDAPDRAEALVSQMIRLADEANGEREDVRPNIFTYNALINCFARRGLTEKAEEYLETVQKLSHVEVDGVTYNSVMNAYATSRRNKRQGALRALELLEEMKSSTSVGPDAVTYGSAIKCLSNAGGKINAEKADELLKELEDRYQRSGEERLAPNTIIYNSVLNAWSNVRGGMRHAESVLDRMEALHAEGNDNVSPDAFTFSTLIKAWTAASSSSSSSSNGGANHNKSKDGDDSNDSDSDLLGRSAAERAQQLLDRMEQLYRDGDDDVKPNAVVYNSVIHAWARSDVAGSAEKAEKLLARMQRLAKSGDDDVRPDRFTFNSAINAWAQAEEYGSAERAESLLNSMERQYIAGDESVKPDIKTYNSCINAWSRTGGPGAGLRAEQLLDRAEALYEETGDDDVRPDKITYASVIHAHAKSFKKGCGELAEAILDHMEEMYEDGAVEARPNPIAFSAAIVAWYNSEVGLSVPRAEGLLMRMLEFVDLTNGKDVVDANKTFDLVIRLLRKQYDEEAIERIEELREKITTVE